MKNLVFILTVSISMTAFAGTGKQLPPVNSEIIVQSNVINSKCVNGSLVDDIYINPELTIIVKNSNDEGAADGYRSPHINIDLRSEFSSAVKMKARIDGDTVFVWKTDNPSFIIELGKIDLSNLQNDCTARGGHNGYVAAQDAKITINPNIQFEVSRNVADCRMTTIDFKVIYRRDISYQVEFRTGSGGLTLNAGGGGAYFFQDSRTQCESWQSRWK